MSFLDHPESVPERNAYFAAANTARGFVSYFSPLFDPYPKYIIKGGPGCGKSTLMKKIANAAEEKGYPTERYFCSSDSSSLDAVVLPSLGFAVLDGTSPHAIEPKNVGAFDKIVNLTAFWNLSILEKERHAIERLTNGIAQSYKSVYALMQATSCLRQSVLNATEDVFDTLRAEKIILRLLEKCRIEKSQNVTHTACPATAFGVKGYLHLTTFEEKAETVFHVKDRIVYSERFFAQLKQILKQNDIGFVSSPRPLDEVTESLFLPDSRILFTRLETNKAPDGIINLDRMLKDRGIGALSGQKAILREIDSLCLIIKKQLEQIGKRHDELESYYIAASDYQALNQFSNEWIASLF